MHSNEKLSRRLKKLENETRNKFKEKEEQIQIIFEAIKNLIEEKEKPKNPMKFNVKNN